MNQILRSACVILALSFVVSACEINSSDTKLQYMPDMADSPTVKPQEGFIDPPEHSVPMTGTLYPQTPEISEAKLKNPYPPSAPVIAEGKAVFEKTCIACHGADAKGQHAMGAAYINPPDITSATYKTRGDGFFFHTITFGIRNMPGYGHSTTVQERWKIVHYLRTLQQ